MPIQTTCNLVQASCEWCWRANVMVFKTSTNLPWVLTIWSFNSSSSCSKFSTVGTFFSDGPASSRECIRVKSTRNSKLRVEKKDVVCEPRFICSEVDLCDLVHPGCCHWHSTRECNSISNSTHCKIGKTEFTLKEQLEMYYNSTWKY